MTGPPDDAVASRNRRTAASARPPQCPPRRLRLALLAAAFVMLLAISMSRGRLDDALAWVVTLVVGLVGVAYWILLPFAAVGAVRGGRLWWLTRRWKQRRRDGLCLRCGYDLRGSAHACPECGLPCPPTRV